MSVLKNIAAIAKGMSITFMEMFQPTTVENYPDGPGPLRGAKFQERYRGVHVLQRDENGLEKCVACFLCAANCPANCIYIEAAENTAEKRVSGAERYAKVYNIDYNRCIFCGYCVEACPTDAITHGHGFEIATFNASALIYRKEQMLAPTLAPGDIVLLDNLRSHKVAGIAEAIEARGAQLIYLPPYSPDLNPIEQAFAKYKALLRKAAERTIETLWQAIGRIADLFSPAECRNFFNNAGYAT